MTKCRILQCWVCLVISLNMRKNVRNSSSKCIYLLFLLLLYCHCYHYGCCCRCLLLSFFHFSESKQPVYPNEWFFFNVSLLNIYICGCVCVCARCFCCWFYEHNFRSHLWACFPDFFVSLVAVVFFVCVHLYTCDVYICVLTCLLPKYNGREFVCTI